MNATLAWGLVLTFVSGLANLLGGYLALRMPTTSRRDISRVIAVAAGFLLAATFLDVLPELARSNPAWLMWTLGGYLVIYITENLFATHAHEEPPAEVGHEHTLMGAVAEEEPLISRSASMAAAVGLATHAFFDGVIIMASFRAGLTQGILLFIAISLHKLPAGFSIASVMRAARYRDKQALLTTVALLLSTTAGAVVILLAGGINEAVSHAIQGLAGGALIYIATTDMIPMTHRGGRQSPVTYTLAGAAIFALSLAILRAAGLGE